MAHLVPAEADWEVVNHPEAWAPSILDGAGDCAAQRVECATGHGEPEGISDRAEFAGKSCLLCIWIQPVPVIVASECPKPQDSTGIRPAEAERVLDSKQGLADST